MINYFKQCSSLSFFAFTEQLINVRCSTYLFVYITFSFFIFTLFFVCIFFMYSLLDDFKQTKVDDNMGSFCFICFLFLKTIYVWCDAIKIKTRAIGNICCYTVAISFYLCNKIYISIRKGTYLFLSTSWYPYAITFV